MTTFNLNAVIKKISDKEKFIAAAAKSVQHQTALIAETEKAIAACSLIQNINGKAVDMAALAGDIIARAGKRLTIADRAVFTVFNVQLNSEKTITKDLVSELFYAKQARLKADAESKTKLEEQLTQQKKLLVTIGTNRALAESELDSIIEFLPEQISSELHRGASAVAKVFGCELVLEVNDILHRVEEKAFKFGRKDGKRVGVTAYEDVLEILDSMLEKLKIIKTAHSGMSVEQREALFSGFNKLNNGLELFKAGEFPTSLAVPVQAPKGFASTSLDAKAAHAVPKEPVFKKLSYFFDKVDGRMIVNSADGVDIVRKLLKTANESRAFSMFKAVKTYRKNPQAALIGVIDNFDLIIQGYLNVAMQQYINYGELSQLDRLFSSPTMVNAGQLTPYGRQVKSYISCVLPYVVLKHKGEGADKAYYFEPVNFNRFSKLGISEKPGFYAFGVRSKSGEDGSSSEDATLPLICIRSHFRISKLLRDLKRADDKRAKEENAREWHDYREKFGREYDRRTLQDEIDSISAALAAKTLELAKIS